MQEDIIRYAEIVAEADIPRFDGNPKGQRKAHDKIHETDDTDAKQSAEYLIDIKFKTATINAYGIVRRGNGDVAYV